MVVGPVVKFWNVATQVSAVVGVVLPDESAVITVLLSEPRLFAGLERHRRRGAARIGDDVEPAREAVIARDEHVS